MIYHPCPKCARRMILETVHEGHDVPCPACGHTTHVEPGSTSRATGELADPPPPARHSSLRSRSMLAMWLGIVSFIGLGGFGCFCVFPLGLAAPFALWIGLSARRQAKDEGVPAPAEATVGLVLGATVLSLYVIAITVFAVMALVASSTD